jgi:hypothetical protein
MIAMYIKLHKIKEEDIVQAIVKTLKEPVFHVFFNDFDVDIFASATINNGGHTHIRLSS